MNIIYKKLSEIKPYEKNPRRNDNAVDAVAESIKQFGFKVPIVIDKSGIIVTGHTRYKASQKLGIDEVPCIVADDLNEAQIKAYRLADNKVSEFAEWDFDLLAGELEDLIDYKMDVFGFDDDVTEEEPEVAEDDFEPEIPKEPKAKIGDIYQLGNHRLMCGDSTKISDVENLMNGNKACITFTSPPYNAGKTPTEVKANKIAKYENFDDDKTEEDYKRFLIDFTNNAMLHSRYVFVNIQSISNNKIALIEYLYELKDIYADTMIWDKMHSQPAMAENVLNSEFEYIHIFSEKANRAIGTRQFRGTISNILHISKQNKNEFSKIHNATFPVEFASFFVSSFANDSVLDLFGGTGTTLIACEQLGKKCFMMEYDPKYVDVIIERWEKLTGEKAVKL